MSATLCKIRASRLEAGDRIVMNHTSYKVRYIEKDPHGYDVYLDTMDGKNVYTFIADEEMVIIEK